MKKHSFITILLTVLMSMVGTNSFAHDIAVANSDGVTIYYVWTNNNSELAVSYRGDTPSNYSNEYSGDVSIPNSVYYNGNYYSVTSIAQSAFEECTDLTIITISSNVKSLEQRAFYGCSSLKYANIPEGVTTIGLGAFSKCSNLTSVIIPSSVTNIGNYAFEYCTSLNRIVSAIKQPDAINNNVFDTQSNSYSVYSQATLVVPDGAKETYKTKTGWKNFTNIKDVSEQKIRSIHVVKAGTLPDLISNMEKYTIEELTLSGEINGRDIILIRDMAGVKGIFDTDSGIGDWYSDGILKNLDISEVTILKSWHSYFHREMSGDDLEYTTEDNILTGFILGGLKLSKIILPKSVIAIRENAISGCRNLTSITIPGNVTSIGEKAFEQCSGLTSIVSEIENPFAIDDNVFDCISKDIYSTVTLTVPAGTKSLYQNTAGWKKFRNIYEKGTSDFDEDNLIAEVDFTAATEFNGWKQFDESQTDGKVELTSEGLAITVGIQTGQLWQPQVMVIPDGSFNLKKGETYSVVVTAKFPTSGFLRINMGSWSANDQADFYIKATGDFQEIVCEFENWSVDAEGAHLLFMCGDFKGTTILKKIEVYDGYLQSNEKWTVVGDESLLKANWDVTYSINNMRTQDGEIYTLTRSNLMLPKGTYEFKVYNNTETQESYPSSNASLEIEEDAVYNVLFNFNSSTKEVTATATKTDGIFYNYIIKGKIAEVIQNPNKYKGDIIIPEKVTHEGVEYTVTKIADHAFSGCNLITSISIPNTVLSIGTCAFYQCNKLTSVTIPSSVTTIGSSAFYGCSSLTSVTISDLEAWCKITFNDNPLSYAHRLFLNGEEIKDLVIPNTVTSISNNAFRDCTGLTSVYIPNSITSFGNYVFQNCVGLTSVNIENGLASIVLGTFSGCTSLTSVTIPNSISSIGDCAFQGCKGLTNLTIPNSVMSIGSYAFYDCSGLASVTLPSNLTSIAIQAFYQCSSLTSVNIPNSVEKIGSQAFESCI